MRKSIVTLILTGLITPVFAHIGPKKIKRIDFPGNTSSQPWLVAENLGLFRGLPMSLQWLCDEALAPNGGLRDLVPVGPTGAILLGGDSTGLHVSHDSGCRFDPVGGAFSEHVIGRILVSPGDFEQVLVTTQTLGRPNDVFRTTDGGRSWQALGLAIQGRIRSTLRARADPNIVYLIHSGGGLRSDDGGASFMPIPIAPADSMATGIDVDLLATHPMNADTVYAVITGFPTSKLIISHDRGATWTATSDLSDVPDSLLVDSNGQDMLMAMPVNGLARSTDSGITWTPLPKPEIEGWISCLTRAPDESVWACVQRGDTELVLRSEDFGVSWSSMVRLDLAGVSQQSDCPQDTPTVAACAYACEEYPAVCEDTPPPTDGGTDGQPPVGPATDAGAGPSKPGQESGGCNQNEFTGSPPKLHWFGLIMTVALGLRRRFIAS